MTAAALWLVARLVRVRSHIATGMGGGAARGAMTTADASAQVAAYDALGVVAAHAARRARRAL